MKSFAVAISLLLLAGPALAERFVVRGGKDAGIVRFVSKAAMESFEGKTHAVTGEISLDPTALGETLALSVVVDMTTLDTGIALRNQHMRENHLHTDKFPTATFTGTRIVEGSGPLETGVARRVMVEGALSIHGVERKVTLPIDLTWDGAHELKIQSAFPVVLADHAIPRPKFLLLKLGETQNVIVALVAERATAAAAAEAPVAADETPPPATEPPSTE